LLRLSGSPESICEQVCTRTVRLLRERLQRPWRCGYPGDRDS